MSFKNYFYFTELSEIEPNVFLRPFLEVIRSEDTTGPITGLALTSVNKFLSYALIGMLCDFLGFTKMPAKCISVSYVFGQDTCLQSYCGDRGNKKIVINTGEIGISSFLISYWLIFHGATAMSGNRTKASALP